MAKITRKLQKVFASGAGATGITEYGSPATGTPVYTTDLDDIQSLTAWDGGWSSAALAGSEIPTFQDFNGLMYTTTNQIKYIMQEGLCEYLSTEEYHTNSIVKKAGTYELYGSLINDNVGNALPSQVDDANWEYLGDLADLGGSGAVTAGEAKAWVTFDGKTTVTINDSHNISSIVRTTQGEYVVTVSNAFDTADFTVLGFVGDSFVPNIFVTYDTTYTRTTTTFKIRCIEASSAIVVDSDIISLTCFGNLA